MASADSITFATPSKHHSTMLFTMSSSPGLPSPGDLFKKAPVLRTGSRATPIPASANAAFTSASSLLKTTAQKDQSIDSIRKFSAPVETDHKVADDIAKPKTRKPRAKKATEDNEAQAKKPPRARIKKAAATADDNSTVKEKAVKKSRAKKAESETQPKLPKARITKSSSSKGGTAEKTKKLSDLSTDTELKSRNSVKLPSGSVVLDSTADTRTGSISKTPGLLPGKGFSGLVSNFGYKNGDDSQQQETPNQAKSKSLGARKRKSPEISTADTVVVKPKSVRKKAKTITDQATAAYVVDVAEEETIIPKRPGAITQFFHYQPKDSDVEKTAADGFKVSNSGSNLRVKVPSKSSKLKPGDQGLPIVLSPQSAIQQHKRQDILFGTSSQLADPENSPTFIRDVQKALRDSNQIDHNFFIDSPSYSSNSTSTSQRIRSHVGRSNLWAASSRDGFGELLNVEVVDLSTMPVAKVQLISAQLSTDENETEMTTEISNEPQNRQSITTRTLHTLDSEDTVKSHVGTKTADPLNVAANNGLAANSAEIQQSDPTRKPYPNTKKAAPTERPDYSTYTALQLTKAVASFGFKPVKRRETMITLLNKCWDGQHGVKTTDQGASGGVEAPKPLGRSEKSSAVGVNAILASSKKPRGRPKKVVEAAPTLPVSEKPLSQVDVKTNKSDSDSEDIPLILRRTPKKSKGKSKEIIVDEISDSEAALTPSPPRRKASKKNARTPSPRRKASKKKASKLAEDSDESSQAELFLHITKAIKSIPPSTSSSEPNWHEKMLLYDPIVLEDLAVWLNTGGLQSVGWDGEVCPSEVKGWCESKSVCCLSRENLKGGARSRY